MYLHYNYQLPTTLVNHVNQFKANEIPIRNLSRKNGLFLVNFHGKSREKVDLGRSFQNRPKVGSPRIDLDRPQTLHGKLTKKVHT